MKNWLLLVTDGMTKADLMFFGTVGAFVIVGLVVWTALTVSACRR